LEPSKFHKKRGAICVIYSEKRKKVDPVFLIKRKESGGRPKDREGLHSWESEIIGFIGEFIFYICGSYHRIFFSDYTQILSSPYVRHLPRAYILPTTIYIYSHK